MMAARAVYKAMEETEIEFGYVNYKETCKYISSNWSEAQVACSNIRRVLSRRVLPRRVLPRRAKNGGSRPGMKNANLLAPGVNQEVEWEFVPNLELTKKEKKSILAHVLAIGVQTIFHTI